MADHLRPAFRLPRARGVGRLGGAARPLALAMRDIAAASGLAGLLLVAGCSGSEAGSDLSHQDEVMLSATAEAVVPAPFVELPPHAIVTSRWDFGPFDGQVIATPNYRIHTTIRDQRLLDRLPVFLEAALARYTGSLARLPAPPGPMESYVFADRRQWEAKTREVIPEQAGSLSGLGRGGFATRGISVLYYIDWGGRDRDTLAIAAHEGWHQYTQNTFRDALPLWLEEGIATWMEGHRFGEALPEFDPARNDERLRALAWRARRGRLIPMEELLSFTPQDFLADSKYSLLAYYGQVWALARFLHEYDDGVYRTALAEVLEDAASGRLSRRLASSPQVIAAGGRGRLLRARTGPWVILEYFNADLQAFETQYESFVQELVESRRRRWR